MASALIDEGNRLFQLGHYDEALSCYKRALDLDRRTGNPRDLADTLGNLANVYASIGKPDEALECYREVLGLHRKLGSRQVIGITLVNIGNLHADRHETERAKAYYLEAIDLLESYNDIRGLAMAYGNLALAVRDEGDAGSAAKYLEKAIRLLRSYGDTPELARTLNSLGKTFLMLDRPDEARTRCEEALVISTRLKDDLGKASAWYNIAAVHESAGRLEEAAEFLARVIEIDERYGLPKLNENRTRLERLIRKKEDTNRARF
jgi:tetratricopeptide (TPR) repeat protein